MLNFNFETCLLYVLCANKDNDLQTQIIDCSHKTDLIASFSNWLQNAELCLISGLLLMYRRRRDCWHKYLKPPAPTQITLDNPNTWTGENYFIIRKWFWWSGLIWSDCWNKFCGEWKISMLWSFLSENIWREERDRFIILTFCTDCCLQIRWAVCAEMKMLRRRRRSLLMETLIHLFNNQGNSPRDLSGFPGSS